MVQHQIHDDLYILFFCLRDQLFHIIQTAEHGINILIIGNVVPVVILRGAVHWRDPHRIDPQIFKIIQPADNPPDISYAVPVRILKAFRINLVDYCIFPPWLSLLRHSQNPFLVSLLFIFFFGSMYRSFLRSHDHSFLKTEPLRLLLQTPALPSSSGQPPASGSLRRA